MTKQAYLCEWKGIECFVAAESRGKAKTVVNNSLIEVFSEHDQWNNIHCRRASQHDTWAASAKGTETVAPEYMPQAEQPRV